MLFNLNSMISNYSLRPSSVYLQAGFRNDDGLLSMVFSSRQQEELLYTPPPNIPHALNWSLLCTRSTEHTIWAVAFSINLKEKQDADIAQFHVFLSPDGQVFFLFLSTW